MKKKEPLILIGLAVVLCALITPLRWFPSLSVNQISLWTTRAELEQRFSAQLQPQHDQQLKVGETVVFLDGHDQVRGVVGTTAQVGRHHLTTQSSCNEVMAQLGSDRVEVRLLGAGRVLQVEGLRIWSRDGSKVDSFALGQVTNWPRP